MSDLGFDNPFHVADNSQSTKVGAETTNQSVFVHRKGQQQTRVTGCDDNKLNNCRLIERVQLHRLQHSRLFSSFVRCLVSITHTIIYFCPPHVAEHLWNIYRSAMNDDNRLLCCIFHVLYRKQSTSSTERIVSENTLAIENGPEQHQEKEENQEKLEELSPNNLRYSGPELCPEQQKETKKAHEEEEKEQEPINQNCVMPNYGSLSRHCTYTEGANPSHQSSKIKRRRPAGLRNLGNTCYFNAVLQNIYQTFLLQELLVDHRDHVETSSWSIRNTLKKLVMRTTGSLLLRNNLPKQQSTLATELRKILEAMTTKSTDLETVDPHDLFLALCERSARFIGGRQQDSHECLRHLLDGLREEEKERNLKSLQSSVDDASQDTLTAVDEVFGGHFITVFYCHTCKMPYHLFEPFLDMSLPIAFEDICPAAASHSINDVGSSSIHRPKQEHCKTLLLNNSATVSDSSPNYEVRSNETQNSGTPHSHHDPKIEMMESLSSQDSKIQSRASQPKIEDTYEEQKIVIKKRLTPQDGEIEPYGSKSASAKKKKVPTATLR